MSGNGNFSNRNFRKVLNWPGATFHPAKPTRNGPNLAENRKIDDFQGFSAPVASQKNAMSKNQNLKVFIAASK